MLDSHLSMFLSCQLGFSDALPQFAINAWTNWQTFCSQLGSFTSQTPSSQPPASPISDLHGSNKLINQGGRMPTYRGEAPQLENKKHNTAQAFLG